MESSQKVDQLSSLKEQLEEKERKARVNAMWEQMNSGFPLKLPRVVMTRSTMVKKPSQKSAYEWKAALGSTSNRKSFSADRESTQKIPAGLDYGTSEVEKLAAAALSAVDKVIEGQNFSTEEAASEEAADNAKTSNAPPPSALDTILEQIKKKPKLSVLDKTKKDWGEFKEENKGLEEELSSYKRSSNQYLDKVSFLHRTDLRQFERERDVRLALQAKRRTTDLGEDDF